MIEWLVELTIPNAGTIPALGIVGGVGKYVTGRDIASLTYYGAGAVADYVEGFLVQSDPVQSVGGRIDIVDGGGFGSLNTCSVEFENSIDWLANLGGAGLVITSATVSIYKVLDGVAYPRYHGSVDSFANEPSSFVVRVRGANEGEYRNIPEVDETVLEVGDVEYIPLGDPKSVEGESYRLLPKRYFEGIVDDKPIATVELWISWIEYGKAGSVDNPRPFRAKWLQAGDLGGAYITAHTSPEEYTDPLDPTKTFFITATLDRVIPDLLSSDMDFDPQKARDVCFSTPPAFSAAFAEVICEIQSKERTYSLPVDEAALDKRDDGTIIVYYKAEERYYDTATVSNLVDGNLVIPDEEGAVQYEMIPAGTGSNFNGDQNLVGDATSVVDQEILNAKPISDTSVSLSYLIPDTVDIEQYDAVYLSWQITYHYTYWYSDNQGYHYNGLPSTVGTNVECGFMWRQWETVQNPYTQYLSEPVPDFVSPTAVWDCSIPFYNSGVLNALGEIWEWDYRTAGSEYLQRPLQNNKPVNATPFTRVPYLYDVLGIIIAVGQAAGGFPVVSKMSTEDYVGSAYNASGAILDKDKLKNGWNYFWFGKDDALSSVEVSGRGPRYYYTMQRVALVGERHVKYGDLYVRRITGSGTGGEIKNVSEFVDELFAYNSIAYATAYAASRENWTCGAVISKKESTKKILQEIAQQAFVGLFQKLNGDMTMVPWRDSNAAAIAHNETTISNVIRVSQTAPTDLINDVTLQYAYDWGESSYTKQYYITNLTAAAFPAYGEDYSEFSNIPSYPDAEAFWNSARQSYLDNNGLRIARSEVTNCRFFTASESVMNSSIHFYLSELVEWATRQKNVIEYEVPVSAESLLIDYLQPIDWSHRVYSGGEVVRGYVDRMVDGESTIRLSITTEPVALVPVYSVIDEDNTIANYIDEDNEGKTVTVVGGQITAIV